MEGEKMNIFKENNNEMLKEYWDKKMRAEGICPITGKPLVEAQKDTIMKKYKLDEDEYRKFMATMEESRST